MSIRKFKFKNVEFFKSFITKHDEFRGVLYWHHPFEVEYDEDFGSIHNIKDLMDQWHTTEFGTPFFGHNEIKENLIEIYDCEYMNNIGMSRDDYWKEVMNRRQPEWCELDRLNMIASHFFHEDESKDFYYGGKLSTFIREAKRPYGNKDKPQSIAYTLGWDWARNLCHDMKGLPDDVKEAAENLHKKLIEQVEEKEKDERE